MIIVFQYRIQTHRSPCVGKLQRFHYNIYHSNRLDLKLCLLTRWDLRIVTMKVMNSYDRLYKKMEEIGNFLKIYLKIRKCML